MTNTMDRFLTTYYQTVEKLRDKNTTLSCVDLAALKLAKYLITSRTNGKQEEEGN